MRLGAQPAKLDERTAIQIEALNRLKNVDLESSPALKGAVVKVLEKTRGTPQFVAPTVNRSGSSVAQRGVMGEVHDGWNPEQGYAAWSDAQLVDAVGASDRGALHELFVRHEPWLATRLSRRCADLYVRERIAMIKLATAADMSPMLDFAEAFRLKKGPKHG